MQVVLVYNHLDQLIRSSRIARITPAIGTMMEFRQILVSW